MIFSTSDQAALGLGRCLGSGGQGLLFFQPVTGQCPPTYLRAGGGGGGRCGGKGDKLASVGK